VGNEEFLRTVLESLIFFIEILCDVFKWLAIERRIGSEYM
jgi:hypothetical protein